MYRYRSFGLSIQAALALPELLAEAEPVDPGRNPADVFVRFGKIETLPPEVVGAARYIRPAGEGIYLGWRDVGNFLVRGGSEIIIDPSPLADESLLRVFVLGTTLAMLLHQRGETVVLHASVVATQDGAIAFLGAKGAGKSTTAGALVSRGNKLLSDDILSVDLRGVEPLALPGFPNMKLWPDSLDALGFESEALPRLRPELEKRSQRLDESFADAPIPLRGIFILGLGSAPAIDRLASWNAMTALMPHWYAARFGEGVLRALGLSSQFLQCAELARRIPVCRLSRPNDLAALPEIARMAETWCAGL